jgi:hypothetical protein
VNHDFAGYHIAANADVGAIDVSWIDEEDPHLSPMGIKGIGEISIVAPQPPSPTPSTTLPASASATSRSGSTGCCGSSDDAEE